MRSSAILQGLRRAMGFITGAICSNIAEQVFLNALPPQILPTARSISDRPIQPYQADQAELRILAR